MHDNQYQASRRGFFFTASVTGAALASAGWLQRAEPAPLAGLPKSGPPRGGGYTLSDHVKQYYKTTRV